MLRKILTLVLMCGPWLLCQPSVTSRKRTRGSRPRLRCPVSRNSFNYRSHAFLEKGEPGLQTPICSPTR